MAPKVRIKERGFAPRALSGTVSAPLAIFLFALLLRFTYLLSVSDHPLMQRLFLDARYYHEWAQKIAAGQWLGDKVFFFDPLYAYILALLSKIFGSGIFWVRFVQIFAGSANAVLVYIIAKRLVSPRAAWISGLLAAAYPLFIFFDAQILKTSFSVCALTLLVLLWTHTDFESFSRKDRLLCLALGLVLGTATLLRGNYLIVYPAVALSLLAALSGKWRKFFTAFGLFTAGFFIAVGPCTWRNYHVGKDFVLTTYGAGSNFYQGNFAGARGGTEVPSFIRDTTDFEEEDPKREAERITGRKLKASEVSRFWSGRTWKLLASDKSHAVTVFLRKFALFWNSYEISGNTNFYFMKEQSPVLKFIPLFFGLIAPFGLWGMWIGRRHWRKYTFLYLVFLFYMGSIVLTHVEGRYRLPMVPILLIFAAPAIGGLYERIRQKRITFMYLVPLILFGIFCNLKSKSLVPYRSFSREYDAMSLYYMEKKDYGTAEKFAQKAIDEAPASSRYWNRLAGIYLKAGQSFAKSQPEAGPPQMEKGRANQYKKAFNALNRSISLNSRNPDTYALMAELFLLNKKPSRAQAAIERYLALKPGDKSIMGKQALAKFQQGKYREAIKAYEEWAIVAPKEVSRIYNNTGLCYKKLKDLKSARDYYIKSISADPDYARPHYNLGLIHLQKGQTERARQEFIKALEIDPNYKNAQRKLQEISHPARRDEKPGRQTQ